MKILKSNLSFAKPLSTRSKTTEIVLHHAEASTASPQQIHEWHLARGWAGAGYNFLVRKNGDIYELRPQSAVGAHATGHNANSVGVCFEGNFMKEKMSAAQLAAGKELVAYLKGQYPNAKVVTHGEVGDTDCPGKNFPVSELKEATGNVKPETVPAEPSTSLKGRWMCTTSGGVKIRRKASLKGEVVGRYGKGGTVYLDSSSTIADGYLWGTYISYSGKRNYVAVRNLNTGKWYWERV